MGLCISKLFDDHIDLLTEDENERGKFNLSKNELIYM